MTATLETERAAVNALLWSGAAAGVADRLDPADFTDRWCAAVVESIVELHAAGRLGLSEPGGDPLRLHERLVARGVHGARDFWRLVMSDVETPMSWLEIALDELAERAEARRLTGRLVAALASLEAGRPPAAVAADLSMVGAAT